MKDGIGAIIVKSINGNTITLNNEQYNKLLLLNKEKLTDTIGLKELVANGNIVVESSILNSINGNGLSNSNGVASYYLCNENKNDIDDICFDKGIFKIESENFIEDKNQYMLNKQKYCLKNVNTKIRFNKFNIGFQYVGQVFFDVRVTSFNVENDVKFSGGYKFPEFIYENIWLINNEQYLKNAKLRTSGDLTYRYNYIYNINDLENLYELSNCEESGINTKYE